MNSSQTSNSTNSNLTQNEKPKQKKRQIKFDPNTFNYLKEIGFGVSGSVYKKSTNETPDFYFALKSMTCDKIEENKLN